MTNQARIRTIEERDEPEWRRLWAEYLDFYGTSVPESVFTTTFQRLLGDDPWMPSAFVAEHAFTNTDQATSSSLIGLVHYLYHSHCWRTDRVCYLQDLYTSPEVRGTGVGRRLIESVYRQADRDRAPSVYWLTQDFNTNARQLYDRIGSLTSFIKYQR